MESDGRVNAAAVADGAGLRDAVSRFLAAVDSGDVDSILAAYDSDFVCTRVADTGGFVRMSREDMVRFWERLDSRRIWPASADGGATTTIQTRETVIHSAEVMGDMGYVLMTRMKNLGNGWEPMFYCLVWQRRYSGQWFLLREFVHQRTVPRW